MVDVTLNRDNVSDKIKDYLRELRAVKLPALPSDPLELFRVLKRETVKGGPYKQEVSVFEYANRALSDLVVLFTAERLLREPPRGLLEFREIVVRLGTDSGFDLKVSPDGTLLLAGECFNVARSYFRRKVTESKKKLTKAKPKHHVLAFNADAGSAPSAKEPGWTYLPIDVDSELNRWSRQPGAQPTDLDR